jgi:hypothetical protein
MIVGPLSITRLLTRLPGVRPEIRGGVQPRSITE